MLEAGVTPAQRVGQSFAFPGKKTQLQPVGARRRLAPTGKAIRCNGHCAFSANFRFGTRRLLAAGRLPKTLKPPFFERAAGDFPNETNKAAGGYFLRGLYRGPDGQ